MRSHRHRILNLHHNPQTGARPLSARTAASHLPPSVPRATTTAVLLAVGACGALAAAPASATISCVPTLSGTYNSTCYVYSGTSLSVLAPGGLISVAGGPAVVASLSLGPAVTLIDNQGTIQSTGSAVVGGPGGAAVGISLSGQSASMPVVTTLTNEAGGVISATGGAALPAPMPIGYAGGNATGIALSNGHVGTMTNGGSISATGGAGAAGITGGGAGGQGIGIDIQSASVDSLSNQGAASAISASGGAAAPAMVPAPGGLAAGIRVGSGSTVGSIQNDGSITATGGAGAAIVPFPPTSGTAYGIDIENSTVTGAITNNGTISASSANGRAVGINLVGSTVDAISIPAGGTINAATAIYIDPASTVTHGINLGGTLNGAVELNNATLNLQGSSAAISGAVHGASASVVNVQGTFTSANSFDVGSFNVAGGATFNMANPVTVSAGLTNAGTLAVAPGTTATINGNYVQAASGVFQTGIGNDGSYGKLVVTGTADLSASNKLQVNVAGAPSLVAGTTVQRSVLSAGSLVAGPALTVSDNSALFDFLATRNGNAVDLCVVRSGATSCTDAPAGGGDATPDTPAAPGHAITVVSSVLSNQNTPALGAARVFDALIAQGAAAPAAMASVITALGTLPTEQAVSDAVKQTLPLLTGGMASVNTAAMHATNRVIQSRQEANRGLSSGDDFVTDKQLWFKPVGSWAKQGDRDGVSGYSASTYGMLLGADRSLGDKTRVGAAFSYMHSRIDGNSAAASQSASVDGYRLIGYGSYSLDARTDVSVQADVGTGHNQGQRSIAFGGLNNRASSSYDSWNTHFGIGIGRIIDLASKTTLTPSLRADYTFFQDAAYTESGADALNLAVGKNSTRELILSTDFRLNQAITDKASFTANLGLGYDALASRSSVTAAFVGGGGQFVTPGLPPARWLMRGGVGFLLVNNKAMEFSVRYDAEVRDRFTNQTASLKLRMPF
ncbi:autotransporter outer membrane beta-barrel domain-containing protein [Cupriavidus sp. USMAHM13]|nr:autotransporter outer membrane beta-barrel domain-containing protein [Cupriavidus sp. USMAHM13]